MKININSEKEAIQSFLHYLSSKKVKETFENNQAHINRDALSALKHNHRFQILSELIDDLLEQNNQSS